MEKKYYFCGMNWLSYIIIGLLVIIAGFVVYVFVETIYKLATGKISKEEIARILAASRREKERKRQRKAINNLIDNLTQPSTMDIVLGRSSKPKTINIDITLEEKTKGKKPYRSSVPCMDHNIKY